MASTKKTTKKTAPRTVKASTKAPTTRKTVAKKSTAKRASTKKPQMRSFHISREERAFMDLQITRQTVYWVILFGFILFAQLWILKLQIEVASLLDIQQQQIQNF